jgi:hypothetical protein
MNMIKNYYTITIAGNTYKLVLLENILTGKLSVVFTVNGKVSVNRLTNSINNGLMLFSNILLGLKRQQMKASFVN